MRGGAPSSVDADSTEPKDIEARTEECRKPDDERVVPVIPVTMIEAWVPADLWSDGSVCSVRIVVRSQGPGVSAVPGAWVPAAEGGGWLLRRPWLDRLRPVGPLTPRWTAVTSVYGGPTGGQGSNGGTGVQLAGFTAARTDAQPRTPPEHLHNRT